jgi:hypothetical protein
MISPKFSLRGLVKKISLAENFFTFGNIGALESDITRVGSASGASCAGVGSASGASCAGVGSASEAAGVGSASEASPKPPQNPPSPHG